MLGDIEKFIYRLKNPKNNKKRKNNSNNREIEIPVKLKARISFIEKDEYFMKFYGFVNILAIEAGVPSKNLMFFNDFYRLWSFLKPCMLKQAEDRNR